MPASQAPTGKMELPRAIPEVTDRLAFIRGQLRSTAQQLTSLHVRVLGTPSTPPGPDSAEASSPGVVRAPQPALYDLNDVVAQIAALATDLQDRADALDVLA